MGIDDSIVFGAIDLVSAGIVGLVFIALVVFCVMAAKTWHWINIVFLILTFMAGVGAILGLAQVTKLRTEAVAKAQKAEADAEKAILAADLAIQGDPQSVTYEPGSLRYIDGVLTREMIGRGRVWTRGQVTADGDNRTYTFATARPADFEPLQDVVLYAFQDLNAYGQQQPTNFIGSVRVVSETPGTITLKPEALADFQQYVQPSGTWSLFEKMPLDRRGTFKKAAISIVESTEEVPEELSTFVDSLSDENAELDISMFRDVLQKLFLQPQKFGLDPNSVEYEALIDRFAFDGLSLGTIQNWIDNNSAGRKSPRFEPSPEEIFVKYEFNQPSRQEGYQVDANGSIETDGLFNPLGHAIDPGLHHGGAVQFDKGDTVLVDQRSADGYQRNGTAVPPFASGEDVKEVDRVYIRQVRDFPYEFGDLAFQAAKVDEEIRRVSNSNLVQEQLIQDANAQLAERVRITNDNLSDQMNLQNDLDTINALVDEKTQKVAEMKQLISSLHAKIDAAYNSLMEASIALSREAFAGK